MKTFPITDSEVIERLIRTCKTCYVGMVDGDRPYVLPMNFGFAKGVIYLHSAPEGHSLEVLERNPHVCITFCTNPKLIKQHPDVACSYRMQGASVLCRGKVEFVEDMAQKREALDCIMAQYSSKQFKYGEPAVRNVKVWRVEVDEITAKEFGVMQPGTLTFGMD